MSHTLNRRNISAIAKLEFAGLSHAQRIDAIAKSLGFETGAALMGSLKSAENSSPAPSEYHAIVAFGSELTSAIEWGEPLVDSNGDSVSGDLKHITFATKAELKAYSQGVDDAQGWMEAYLPASQDDQPDHPFFKAIAADPGLTFENWYAADLVAKTAEGDDDI